MLGRIKRVDLLSILIASISFVGVSCSPSERGLVDPPNTATIEMMDQDNGKTILGNSSLYIDRSNNFRSSSSLVADVGPVGGVGVHVVPRLNDLHSERAVKPGHSYQIFDKKAILDFPSSVRAIALGVPYYRLYVERPISRNGVTVGAVVKYLRIEPESYGFSLYDSFLGQVRYGGDRVEMALRDGMECHWDSSINDLFYTTHHGGKLQLTLKDTPATDSFQFGTYWLYVRLNDVFVSLAVSIVK